MNKSLYSLLLYDELVSAVDAEAVRLNTNRSNLINKILSDYFDIETPLTRRHDIFDELLKLFDNSFFRVESALRDGMLSIYSPLRYRYNPTIRYNIEISRRGGETSGELRTYVRSQNISLLNELREFFYLWSSMEVALLKELGYEPPRYEISEGRYTRHFIFPANAETSEIAQNISRYINILDEAMKNYLSSKNTNEVLKQLMRIYE